jgi:excisionase family DNA binding protein
MAREPLYTPDQREPLYTPDQVAAYLQITKQTVMGHIRDGQLRARKVGRFWRVTESDLQDYLGGDIDLRTILTHVVPGEAISPIPNEDRRDD